MSSGAARSAGGGPAAWEEVSADVVTPKLRLCAQVVVSATVVASAGDSEEDVEASVAVTEALEEASTAALVAASVAVIAGSAALLMASAAVPPMRRADPALTGADTAADLIVTARISAAAVGMADEVTMTGLAVVTVVMIGLALAAMLSLSATDLDTAVVGIVTAATVATEVIEVTEATAVTVVTEATMTAATTLGNDHTRAAQATRESGSFVGTNRDGTDAGPVVGIFSPLVSLLSSSHVPSPSTTRVSRWKPESSHQHPEKDKKTRTGQTSHHKVNLLNIQPTLGGTRHHQKELPVATGQNLYCVTHDTLLMGMAPVNHSG